MNKKLIIVGIITCFLGIGTLYACVCKEDEHYCNYPNCTQEGYHNHYNENETYHCEISGCNITSPHTHGNNAYNNENNNNYTNQTVTYGHHGNGHHRNSCHNH